VSLEQWAKFGFLEKHKTSKQEVAQWLAAVDRDLADCRVKGLSADRRLTIAYGAGLLLANASLAACGHRPNKRESHHYYALQSLAFTIGTPSSLVAVLDKFRRKRNEANYDHVGVASDQEAEELTEIVTQLRAATIAWLKQNYPALI
jgi:hypothetical protein